MRLTVKVADEVVASVGRVATNTGRPFEEIVDEALRDYLEKNPPRPMPVRRN